MSDYLVRAGTPGKDGLVAAVSKESAGWKYVGFEVYQLKAGDTLIRDTEDNEVCLVLLSGKADVKADLQEFSGIGERMSVFENIPPYAVYVPAGGRYEVTALTELELGVCLAPGTGKYPARLIAPSETAAEARGYGSMSRRVVNILPESSEAESLLVVEVRTDGGNWSSYPPHKHDRDHLPEESYLEETYYHRVNPGHGFVVQRVYNDDRSLDETMAVPDRSIVLVPEGYHPVSAPPGYDSYYLNVMAGPVRTWVFHNDPEHEWLFRPGGDNRGAQEE
ncbi:5-deoxyglucuronate isomerase [Paenibacillus sp. FSL R7-0273]|uniref:5-deoxy-glucuronate isomerase n=1 Tax=Paenibacillus sp. FSL R7-0273 TaxID=1536772 RepID=UPI0004F89D1E|nr:5-deoxy-glucuronate isomerase [Paenibacillus sp. FSL R7-0273]AIQ44666.1 5-deoxyglucuronate isomerase [Paenibacillus sp. FSL R7-0273]OMF88195.1 5-deoxy-glucuronate isomerase [Paenibacillus sp. FSL R7-0273]